MRFQNFAYGVEIFCQIGVFSELRESPQFQFGRPKKF